jgi:hypothetical protein
MSVYSKLVQALRKVVPNVKGTPLDRNEFLNEIANEPVFIPHIEGDYKVMALELWRIIEDIEKVDLATEDNLALRSLVRELTPKRFIYMNDEMANELSKYQMNKQMHNL